MKRVDNVTLPPILASNPHNQFKYDLQENGFSQEYDGGSQRYEGM